MAWRTRSLQLLDELAVKLDSPRPVYFLADARVVRRGDDMHREDLGFRIERVVQFSRQHLLAFAGHAIFLDIS